MIYALDTNILSFTLREDRRVCDRYRLESRKGGECVIPQHIYAHALKTVAEAAS